MGEPLAVPLFWAAIFSNNGGCEKGNKGKLWGQTEVSCLFFNAPASVMPDLRRASARRKESFQLKDLSWLAFGLRPE
ncbi:hypothetical protein G6L16_015785 [Agrobacterium tumefaciens]|uniref:hypothetical protein n=1 Tax=Agrobacterium tumefaciens TaxID=358 RepID=UPI001573D8F5|nr:hypothetical protein [Agrobacterium tumefaciens]NSZ65720.1 hypothetical protein [Agrobacterium tumefaciens]NTA72091.1 hypothetical protein [Agrobacterium tumefaciens]WIE39707.1 hypothetical protein G6L16_015785 [Agrobacterium tumefaciens]